MRVKFAIVVGAIFFLSQQTALGQQFNLEWEVEGDTYYVGDLDGDGVGEFAIRTDNGAQFYDGANHTLKWTVTGWFFSGFWCTLDRNPFYLFPSIDYNGDGVREVLFRPRVEDGEGVIIMDVTDNTAIFEFSDAAAIIDLIACADVDGDGELELVICKEFVSSCTTYVYSTGVTTANEHNPNNHPLMPSMHKLNQNYPNPFNPTTKIEYSVQKPGKVCIKVYNTLGQLVRTLVNENKGIGNYTVIWDGKDEKGDELASGVYFYAMQVGNYTSAKKAILLK